MQISCIWGDKNPANDKWFYLEDSGKIERGEITLEEVKFGKPSYLKVARRRADRELYRQPRLRRVDLLVPGHLPLQHRSDHHGNHRNSFF